MKRCIFVFLPNKVILDEHAKPTQSHVTNWSEPPNGISECCCCHVCLYVYAVPCSPQSSIPNSSAAQVCYDAVNDILTYVTGPAKIDHVSAK